MAMMAMAVCACMMAVAATASDDTTDYNSNYNMFINTWY